MEIDDYNQGLLDFWNGLPRNMVKNTLEILNHEDAVKKVDPDHWEVISLRTPTRRVRVYRRGDLIRCASDKKNNHEQPCSHILVVMVYEGMIELPNTSYNVYKKGTKYQKGVKGNRDRALEARAWRAVPVLLPDYLGRLLRAGLPVIEPLEPERPGPGRPPAALYPQVYQAVMRVWERRSLCAAQGAMGTATHRQHNPYGPVGAATLSRFLNDPANTETLEKLLLLSTWPAKPYETIFHQDGTGLTSQRFGAYFQEKYRSRTKREEHRWLFAVILWTYRYTMIPALRAANGNFGEPEWTIPLLERARIFHSVKEFGGDRAYQVGYIFQYAQTNDIEAPIKFKKNATGSSAKVGKQAFKRALELSRLDPGYNARADRKQNVESGNHALKSIFGDKLYSKHADGQRNELLCMAIGYNLTRLAYLSLEQEIEIDFTGGSDILRASKWSSLKFLHQKYRYSNS